MLTINTLGNFQVSDGENVLNDNNLRSVMLTKLFMYLVLYRNKPLATETIVNSLWGEEEIDNPVGALKNLMYRLRKSLQSIFKTSDEYIITTRGFYQWNTEIPIILDIESFEQFVSKAKTENETDKAIQKYENAINIFQGDFMTNISDSYWISSLSTYYHSMYLSAVKALADLYEKTERYEALESLTSSALLLENADEQLLCYQIEARMRLNKITLALESYDNAKNILEREMGIRKTTILNKVYEELLQMGKQTAADINEVHQEIVEGDPEGVFFCGYPIFREIYHLEARKATRSNEEVSLVLLSFEGKKTDPQEVADFRIKQAMDGMELCIRKSLRVGDVASRYSDSQYILLLATCNDELAHIVGNRLIAKLYDTNEKYRNVVIKMNIENITSESHMIQ